MAPINCNCNADDSVETEVHVKHSEENRHKYAIPCSNRYVILGEHELDDRKKDVEACVTASIVKNLSSDSEYWEINKNKNVCVLRRSNKPVIILRHDANVWNALADTSSERCLLNY